MIEDNNVMIGDIRATDSSYVMIDNSHATKSMCQWSFMCLIGFHEWCTLFLDHIPYLLG